VQLIIITCIARVAVMRLIVTFFVLNLMFVVLGVLVALLRGVLALWLVHQAWLEHLVAAIRRGPVLPFLFSFVEVITPTAVIAVLPQGLKQPDQIKVSFKKGTKKNIGHVAPNQAWFGNEYFLAYTLPDFKSKILTQLSNLQKDNGPLLFSLLG
jgi:hypothetical protein